MKRQRIAAFIAGLWLVGPALAATTAFTSKTAFDAAIAGMTAPQTVDFESSSAGDTFASGTGTGGLSFVYTIAGPSTLQVASTFGTTSGLNYLGLDNPDTAFYLGDSVTIEFNRTVHAVGLYIVAGSDIQAGDVTLTIATGSVANSAIADTPVSDGQAFYLGLVDSTAGFTSATLSGTLTPNAFLAFTVDDITSAAVGVVPEPASWGLMLAGLAALPWLARRRRA